ATYTVPARSITLSPTSGGRGSAITVRGTGFGAGLTVTFNYGPTGTSADPVIPGVSATADSAGAFTAVITVPAGAPIPSTNFVRASDGVVAATAVHTVPDATVSLSASSGAPGTSLTVSGSGFAPFSQVRIAFGAPPGEQGATEIPLLPAVITDATGSFSASVTVPGLAPGVTPVFVLAGDLDGVGGVAPADARSALFTITARPTTIADLIAPIRAQITRGTAIWTWDPGRQEWLFFDPADPAGSTLRELVRGQGYWIRVDADTTWTVAGNTYTLRRGWNLIGWLGP
ncbi:MAG: hypothetical protein RMK40_08510, partial [Chloroflexota bacterium]|nr:hypothetical protein [Chloroflexota bacterium]